MYAYIRPCDWLAFANMVKFDAHQAGILCHSSTLVAGS